ncbi:hypothetical protein [Kineosporia sp. NBRC 101731]|uniref:aggregation-promoting factor C-terminal-like domain-containing protein n=1 Tax=Kineosporia sp. NBRC 101731 TaxID=3032199 RepID=UPI00249FC273|nr:hypothetical protein [Kineosporia sp. NBRC 101731]GLY32276.1 hypothetical protein Kisp02_56410 [Kineosporia sp. NBRC 101731]
MTTTVGPETEEDLAEHWLNTGGIPVLSQDGIKSYPKRSDLRRAEARAAARRTSHTRPSGSRPSGHQSRPQRPSAPASAPRSAEATRRPTLQTQYPHAMLPTPAVLPIPRTNPGRPAGIDMPVPPPPSADAFHRSRPQPPLVPLAVSTEWGLDLTADPTAPESSPEAPRRRIGRLHGTATRLLVMALVVGAEGIAVSQFADPFDADSSSSTAAFALDALQEQPSADASASAAAQAEAEAERAEVTATTLQNIKDASPAKAKAAAAQSQKASAEQARQRRAAAKAAKEKKEAEQKAAALAEAKAKAKAEAAASEPTASASSSSSSSSSALSLANSRKNPQAAAKILLTDRGWSSAQYTCLDSLWTRESSWNYQATNPSSGAYGIPQSLPGSKMASAGSDWKTNPVTQIRWGLDYISDRYGTPCGAWSHSESVGWY